MSFRYDTSGTWYKGNTHIHSTASDGGRTPAELAFMYAAEGYDFLFRTDHWVASNVRAEETEVPLLWLDGIELDGRDHGGSQYHVVCLGTFSGITREMGFVSALESARSQGGFLILAHPHWMGNTLEDALRWGFHGVEIYNHVCRWLNGKGDGMVYWNAMLSASSQTLAFGTDDAHIRPEHPGWNGGWIMVNAPCLSEESIRAGVRSGNYYSTCGPEIHSIDYDGTTLLIRTSPVQFVRLVGPAHLGSRIGSFEGDLYSEAAFRVPEEWPYVYLEVEDDQGRRAWTNALFC